MNRRSVFCYLVLLVAVGSVYAINITGRITNGSGSAIQGAIVSLQSTELRDITGWNGNFTLSDGVVGTVRRQTVPSVQVPTMKKGIVHFSLTERTPVRIDLFDVQGNLLRSIMQHTLGAGMYRYDIASDPLASRMLAVRVQIGRQGTIFRYLPMRHDSHVQSAGRQGSAPVALRSLAKLTAAVDSLIIEAEGYTRKSVALDTLFGEVNVTLDTEEVVIDLPHFSFFVTSLAALQELSGSEDGFGGDFRFGHTGPGAGLKGADSICECIAERSMKGSKVKKWRAFLSVTEDENGDQVNAIDRIGDGPWYDRLGRMLAPTKDDLLNTRPQNGDEAIMNDLPNEDGVPNHHPDPNVPEVDNHHTVTGSNEQGELYSSTSTCEDWTSSGANSGNPQCGFSWPRRVGSTGRGAHWISGFAAGGCEPGIELIQNGGGTPGATFIGNGGGYGGFYCFALNP